MKFNLTIELGNEAMTAGANVAKALERSLLDAERNMFSALQAGDEGVVRDVNGNSVGHWQVAA